MKIVTRIISTGGTIDSSLDYNPKKKSVFSGSNLKRLLKQARLTGALILEPLMQKDSGDITESDRHLMLERCRKAKETKIIVTHGTDTMSETARFLGRRLKNKTVVLVGSFVPFSHKNSDAPFNIGYAIAAAQRLPKGVYVCMGGETFVWNNVRKNMKKRRFERAR